MKIHFIIILISCFFLDLNAQVLPKLKVQTSRVLSISDELPTDCFEQVFTDASGRMWLTPCSETQKNRGIHLIQFDGYAGTIHDLDFGNGSIIILGGFLKDSVIVGVDLSKNVVFKYSIKDGMVEKFHSSIKYLIYNIQIVKNRIFLLATIENRHFILELSNGSFVVKSEINGIIPAPNPDWTIGLLRKVVSIDETILFTDLRNKIYSFNTITDQLEEFQTPQNINLVGANLINWQGNLLVGFRAKGVFQCLSIQGRNLEYVQFLPQGATFSEKYDKAEFLIPIFADESGWLFIRYEDKKGTIHNELIDQSGNRYDYSEVYNQLPDNNYGLLSGKDFTNQVMTISGSVILIEIQKQYGLKSFESFPGRAMLEVEKDKVLALTDIQPIVLDLKEQKIIPSENYSPVNPTERKTLFYDSEKNIWTFNSKSIIKYDPTGTAIREFTTDVFIDFIIYHKERILIIAQNTFYELDQDSGSIKELVLESKVDKIEGYINMVQIQSNSLWIATSAGLWLLDLNSKVLNRIVLGKYGYVPLLSCFLDSKGYLWLGSEFSGVLRFDSKTQDILICEKNNGLSHNTVVGFLEDDENNMWISTFNGINVLNRNNKIIAKFFEKDGLCNNEGNRWSILKLSDGRMLFGSVAGFTVLDPKLALQNFNKNLKLNLYCKSISYFSKKAGKQIELINPDLSQYKFILPSDSRNLEVNVGSSDYLTSNQTEFLYKINKPDYQWVSVGKQPKLTLPNLPRGSYEILIQGLSSKGIWSENILTIPIYVPQPFYLRWWFFLLCSLPFIGYLILWNWRVKIEKKILEEEVQKRTAQIEAQKEELQELDQAKTKIYTNITHEFRTPLTVIKGANELIEGNNEKKMIIKRNSDRLLNLVNQMLELSKLESGSLIAKMVQLNIVNLIREIFESFIPLAQNKDLGMHFYAHPHEIMMDCDIEIIHRIIGNLISNAIKFTGSGGNIYVEIGIVSEAEIELLKVSIRDTGIGISKSKLDKIFNRFYQADDTITRVGEGTGIGLALSKELLEFLNGSIQVNSEPGEGSKFMLSIPIAKNAELKEEYHFSDILVSSMVSSNQQNFDSFDPHTNETQSILIVEDNPDLIHYLMQCLQNQYNIHAAMDGQEGFEKAIQIVPDLILSDVMMPIMDGLQLCEQIKKEEKTSHIPLVLLSAKGDIESRIEGFQIGADAYLPKPFDKNELLLIVRNMLDSRLKYQNRYLRKEPIQVLENDAPDLEDIFLSRLDKIIADHIADEEFSVTMLCHSMKYSRSQIHNKVKALTGLSTSTYIQTARLMKSKELLADGKMNVSEVAYTVGFKDPNYFSRVFRKEFGITPSSLND